MMFCREIIYWANYMYGMSPCYMEDTQTEIDNVN
jgi:hypothetical protein